MSIIRDLEASLRPEALLWFRLLLQRAHLGDAGHPDPSLVSEFVFPIQWFLDEVGGAGIRLTDAGYLPPDIVSKAMVELGWDRNWYGKANREIQTAPVRIIRQSMHRAKLLYRRNGILQLTPLGRKLTGDPPGMWDLLARSLTSSRSEVQSRAWEFFLLSLAATPTTTTTIRGREVVRAHEKVVAEGLWSIGWQTRAGEKMSVDDVYTLIGEPWRTVRWLGATARDAALDPWAAPPASMIAFARYCLTRPDFPDTRRDSTTGRAATAAHPGDGETGERTVFLSAATRALTLAHDNRQICLMRQPTRLRNLGTLFPLNREDGRCHASDHPAGCTEQVLQLFPLRFGDHLGYHKPRFPDLFHSSRRVLTICDSAGAPAPCRHGSQAEICECPVFDHGSSFPYVGWAPVKLFRCQIS